MKLITEAYEGIFEGKNQEQGRDGSIFKNYETCLGNKNSNDGINTEVTEVVDIVDVISQEVKDKENRNNISGEDEAVKIEINTPQNEDEAYNKSETEETKKGNCNTP